MGLFYRVKKGDRVYLEEQTVEELKPVPVQMPTSTASVPAGVRRYCCIACDPPKPFAGQGAMSIHFGKRHKDLVKSKDSWREYLKEFGSLTSEPDPKQPAS